MKKLLFVLLFFTLKLQAQEIILFGDETFYTYQAVTEYNTVTSTTATIRGSITRTKSDKANGSTGADGYMRWWLDSTNIVTNGTFDTDLSGWTIGAGTNWRQSGGKLVIDTAALVNTIICDDVGDGVVLHKLTFDMVADSGDVYVYMGNTNFVGLANATQTYTFYSNLAGDKKIYFSTGTAAGANHFGGSIDNVVMIDIADSSLGLSKAFTLGSLIEDTTYNYDFVTIPRGGNDSYSDGADSTFTTSARNLIVNKLGNKAMLFKNGTYAIKLKE